MAPEGAAPAGASGLAFSAGRLRVAAEVFTDGLVVEPDGSIQEPSDDPGDGRREY